MCLSKFGCSFFEVSNIFKGACEIKKRKKVVFVVTRLTLYVADTFYDEEPPLPRFPVPPVNSPC